MAGVSGTSGVSGQTTKWASTTNAYEWWDGALQGTISYKPDLNGAPGTTYVTTFAYNGMGQLASVNIVDGRKRDIYYKHYGDTCDIP